MKNSNNKIEPQKYILGDLVEYKREPRRISKIETFYTSPMCLTLEPYAKAEATELSGIKLTTEILNDNDWVHIGDNVFYDGNETHLKLIKTSYGYNAAIFEDKVNEMKVIGTIIHYVHELQHLLYGLGFDANMKVKQYK